MKLKLALMSFLVLAAPVFGEYSYNGYSPYDSYSSAYTLGGNSLYNLVGTGNGLSNYYGNSYSPYSSSSMYSPYYSSGYGSCSSIYYTGCTPYNNFGFSGYTNPYSFGSYNNGYGLYSSLYGGYSSSYPYSSGYNTGNYYSNGYGGYSYYTPGGYDYYYIPGSSYYSGGYGGGYYGGIYNYNYSPININVYAYPQGSLGGCNGVTIPCGTDVVGTPIPPVTEVPIPPVTTPISNTIPTDPSRTRIPRGIVGVTHR